MSLFAAVERAMHAVPLFVRTNQTVSPKDGVLHESAQASDPGRVLVEKEPHKALLLSALRHKTHPAYPDSYALLLDLDVQAVLRPSSTPGHSHLYIDAHMTRSQHNALLRQLYRAGIIQKGFADSGINSRYGTTLRLPWVKKGEDLTIKQREKKHEQQRKQAALDAKKVTAAVERAAALPVIFPW